MKTILSFIVLLAIMCCCSTKRTNWQQTSSIKAISIIDTLPLLSNDGQNAIFYPPKDKRIIYFYKDYILYRIPWYHNLDIGHWINDSFETITNKKDTTYFYYARKGEDSLVYKIDSLTDMNFKMMSADSLFKSSSMYKTPSFDQKNLSQYASKVATYETDKLLIEKYASPPNHSDDVFDTCYQYFSKEAFWKDISFDISNHADNSNKLKVIKVKLIFNKNPISKNITLQQGFKLSSEMVEEKIFNQEQLLTVFKRFEEKCNKNNR